MADPDLSDDKLAEMLTADLLLCRMCGRVTVDIGQDRRGCPKCPSSWSQIPTKASRLHFLVAVIRELLERRKAAAASAPASLRKLLEEAVGWLRECRKRVECPPLELVERIEAALAAPVSSPDRDQVAKVIVGAFKKTLSEHGCDYDPDTCYEAADAVMALLAAPVVSAWTTEPPKVAGWYWWRVSNDYSCNAIMRQVGEWPAGGLVARECHDFRDSWQGIMEVEKMGGEWQGPIEPK